MIEKTLTIVINDEYDEFVAEYEVDFEYSVDHDPGRLFGKPEDCYPGHTDFDFDIINVWEGEQKATEVDFKTLDKFIQDSIDDHILDWLYDNGLEYAEEQNEPDYDDYDYEPDYGDYFVPRDYDPYGGP